MPKKRTYNFKQLQGSSSSAPNLPTAAGRNGDCSPSVNERLSELRRQETKDSAAKKRQLAESLNQRSVPPEIRGLLGVPESAPPKPKANVRARERMRTPGPAPPKSWVRSDASALLLERQRTKHADKNQRSRPRVLLRFARLAGSEGDAVDQKPPSLMHLALKALAESWDLFDEQDYPDLLDIPLRLRLRLLSYIDFYGLPIGHSALQALLQGGENITQLDLAGLIGHKNLTLKKITKLLEREQEPAFKGNVDTIVESWDTEESSFENAIRPSLQTTRFSHLTHLCLSHPAPSASWRDLLALSKLTPQITHLSLAYWPWPTLTPNLTTTTISSQHSPEVHAGGSNYYSAMDQSLSEPASLLRQLSGHWLYLQWLDLEGCADWMPALAKLAEESKIVIRESEAVSRTDDWTAHSHNAPSVFASNWRNLTYLRCAQGTIPSLAGIQGLLARREDSIIDAMLVNEIHNYVRTQEGIESGDALSVSQDVYDAEKKKARIWMECEYRLTYACMRINSARRRSGCRPIGVDFGWIKRHVTAP